MATVWRATVAAVHEGSAWGDIGAMLGSMCHVGLGNTLHVQDIHKRHYASHRNIQLCHFWVRGSVQTHFS